MTQFGVYLDAIQAIGSKIVLFMGFPGDFKLIFQQAKLRGMLGPDWVWFLHTWTATVVYANLARGIISLAPPGVKPTSKTGTKIMSTTAGKAQGAAMPLAQLAFVPSPVGTPAACLELVHLEGARRGSCK
ncbi:hypothetical protein AMAG_11159 [Allomyces macrogynus ATCC 38327]|uniref:Uncharacterized protein n=1 Tax=Allomyces macrogynus (strain ATCC 38327) TaxID=578462 RepID=A0A0L0SSL1_ALLM3|nr:hypothetical protein AMAG_11159 [Allomyces macrogynus ATCC 38327]|eukprot:KNE65548.1 hypothetical protein AMAG_11159 [Allomyces macrogynus ATCC 38327]